MKYKLIILIAAVSVFVAVAAVASAKSNSELINFRLRITPVNSAKEAKPKVKNVSSQPKTPLKELVNPFRKLNCVSK